MPSSGYLMPSRSQNVSLGHHSMGDILVWKECPWRTTNCGYGAPRNLCTSKIEATKGQKFLKCINSQCLKFVWLKEAMQAEKNNSDEEINKNGQLNAKMTVSMDLNDFCRGFKGKTTLG
ncbi:hypothetical protein GIB67_014338 [Kingdonia uniflora]|uniref:Zinc finger GRF-type domain-containing protein n=1 Tax=Kingdonia uniflora TaxID=39325 RepID=A0A7J7NU24_9MAGN|nr:hypothetical protein GIB67_014338 [Kingdonia uniflora]